MKKKKLLTLFGSICLVLVLAALLLPACAKPAPAPPPTPPPPTPAPAPPTPAPAPKPPPAKPLTLKVASYLASGGTGGTGVQAWAKFMEEKTNGRLKCEFYWSAELLGSKEMLDGVKTGIADMGYLAPLYYPSAMVINNMIALPGTPPPRADWAGWVSAEWVKQPTVKAEMDKYNLVHIYADAYTPSTLISKVPIRTCDDFKGVRIRAAGDVGALLAKFGAVPVMIPWGEVYTSLDTGLLDAHISGFASVDAYKFDEPCSYWIGGWDLAVTPVIWAANNDSYNALPDDIKDIIQGEAKPFMAKWLQWKLADPDFMEETKAAWVSEGIEIIQFPPAEKAKLVAECEGIWEAWIERAGGEPARDVLSYWFALVEEVKTKYPDGILPLYKP